MKFSFIKSAAALLAGALLAVACSKDYEADIQRLENKIDQITSGTGDASIPTLQAQLKSLENLVKSYNDKLKGDLDNNLADQTAKYNELLSKYNNLSQQLTEAKQDLISKINAAESKISELGNTDKALEKEIQDAIKDYSAKIQNLIDQMNAAVAAQANKDGAQDQRLKTLEDRLNALEVKIVEDLAACNAYTDSQIKLLKDALEKSDAELSAALAAYKEEMKAELGKMKDDIKAAEAAIVTLQANMKTLQETTIPELKQKIQDLDDRLRAAEIAVAENAANITANKEAAEAAIAANKELILANQAKIKALQDQLTETYNILSQAITDMATVLRGEMDDIKTELSKTIGLLDNRVTALEEDSEEQLKLIEANAAEIEAIWDVLNDEEKGVTAIWDAIAAMDDKINVLEVSLLARIQEVADSVGRLDDKVVSEVARLEGAIEGVQKNLDDFIEALNASLMEQHAKGLKYIADTLDNYYTKEQVDALDKALKTDLEGQLKAKADEIIAAYTQADAEIYAKMKADSTILGGRLDVLEDKMKTLEEETIPGILLAIATEAGIREEEDGKLQDAIDELAALVDEKEALIYAKINADSTYLKDLIDGLAVKTDRIESEYKAADLALQGQIDDIVNVQLPELADKLGKIGGRVGDLEGRLDDEETGLDAIWLAIANIIEEEIPGAIDGLREELKGDYDKKISDLSEELQGKIAELGEDLQGQIDEICENYVKAEDFASFIADTYTPAIEGINAAIAGLTAGLKEITDNIVPRIDVLEQVVTKILNRIQSVQYVPTHSDLKITTNLAALNLMGMEYVSDDEPAGNMPEVFDGPAMAFFPMLTEITYKVNPEDAFKSLDDLKEIFETMPNLFKFDVVPVETRADDADGEVDPAEEEDDDEDEDEDDAPEYEGLLNIVGVKDYDPATGKITFNVLPDGNGILNMLFALNGVTIEPADYLSLHYFEDSRYWDHTRSMWRYYNEEFGLDLVVPVYDADIYIFNMLKEFALNFAAALEIRKSDTILDPTWVDDPENAVDFDIPTTNISSPYYVLYPNIALTLRPAEDPQKDTSIGTGDGQDSGYWDPEEFKDKTGIDPGDYKVHILEPIENEVQELAYNATEEKPWVPDATKPEEKVWFRTILDGVVPAYEVSYADNDGSTMVRPEDLIAIGVIVPPITLSDTAEFTYENAEGYSDDNPSDKPYFANNEATYAKVIMDPETSNLRKREAIGWTVTGTYTFTVGGEDGAYAYYQSGDVIIVKDKVTVPAATNINWEYANDAEIDHNIAFGVDGDTDYARDKAPVIIDPQVLANVLADKGVQLSDLVGIDPIDMTIKIGDADPVDYYVENEVPNPDEPEGEPITEIGVVDGAPILNGIHIVNIDDEGVITVVSDPADVTENSKVALDITGFAWDKTYVVTGTFETDFCDVILVLTITTKDRNRDKIVLDVAPFFFEVNKPQPEGVSTDASFDGLRNGFTAAKGYFAESKGLKINDEELTMLEALYAAFVKNGIWPVAATRADIDEEDLAAFVAAEFPAIGNKTVETADIEKVPGLDIYYEGDDLTPGDSDLIFFRSADVNDLFIWTRDLFDPSNNSYINSIEKGWTPAKLKELAVNPVEGNPYQKVSDPKARRVVTYIGQLVEASWALGYEVPAYDFQHQSNFTFKDNVWYAMASPKYDVNKKALKHYDVNYMNVPALAFNVIDKEGRIFNYMDENIADDDPTYFYNDSLKVNFFYSADRFEEGYKDSFGNDGPKDETALEEQSQGKDINGDDVTTYGGLWFNSKTLADEYYDVNEAKNFQHCVFYYRSIRDAIPMYGTLAISSGEGENAADFEIPTSFEPDNGYIYPAEQDYSNFELRAWKPFYVPQYEQTLYIDLDEHGKYYKNILEGLQFYDGRQVAASTPINAEDPYVGVHSVEGYNYGVKCFFNPMLGYNWIPNAQPTAQAPEYIWGIVNGNTLGEPSEDAAIVNFRPFIWDEEDGIVEGGESNGFYFNGDDEMVTSFEAYDINVDAFDFDPTGLPAELRRIVSVPGADNGDFTMVFDYTSQQQFSGTATIVFKFDFKTPWQEFDTFWVNVVVRGQDAQVEEPVVAQPGDENPENENIEP